MKRTVYNTMIGLMLVCGLAMTSTGAMAQGRRPASTNNAAATGNRSVATAPKNNAATVTNNNNSSRSTVTNVSPQINNRTTTTGTRSTTGNSGSTTVRPNTGNNGSNNRNTGNTTVRPNTGGNHGTGNTTVINANTGNRSASGSNNTTVRTNTGGSNNNGSGNVRPNTGGNNTGNGTVRPNTGGNNNRTNSGHSTVPNGRPDNRPKVKGSVVTGGGPKIDYSTYRYNSSWRPRYDGDRFFDSFRYNSWSWNKPIRPSVRPWRPATMWVYRPIVTVNVSSYYGYPTIGGVLGLTWGTSFGNALNYLYYNGYYIDGYMDNIVYLTDVELLDYDWDDVMMEFDGNNRLDYVQFSYWTDGYNTSRFFSLYNYLVSLYGSPVSYSNSMYSWYGGDGIGYVNLGLDFSTDVCYTVLAFGV